MQIGITLLAPAVTNVVEIDGWVCGTLAPPAPGATRLSTVLATRPWITHSSAIDERKALVDFVNLPNSPAEIVRFIRVFGLFSEGDQARIAGRPEKVNALWRDSKLQRPAFATNIASLLQVRDELVAILSLARSAGKRSRDLAIEQLARTNPGFVNMIRSKHPKDFAKQLVSIYVSLALEAVRLGVVPDRGKMTALALAFDVRSALYLAVLSEIVSGTYLKKCKRADCPKLFVATPPSKKYHDAKCQHVDLMRRCRKR